MDSVLISFFVLFSILLFFFYFCLMLCYFTSRANEEIFSKYDITDYFSISVQLKTIVYLLFTYLLGEW